MGFPHDLKVAYDFMQHEMRVWIFWGDEDLDSATEICNSEGTWVKIKALDNSKWVLREIRFIERPWHYWCDGQPSHKTIYTCQLYMKDYEGLNNSVIVIT